MCVHGCEVLVSSIILLCMCACVCVVCVRHWSPVLPVAVAETIHTLLR